MTVWYDLEATNAAVLATLRLQGGDVDAGRIADAIPRAAATIEQQQDRVDPIPGPPPHPLMQGALEAATIALYHRDAVVATIGGGVSTLGVPADRFDPLADVYVELISVPEAEGGKQQWGVA